MIYLTASRPLVAGKEPPYNIIKLTSVLRSQSFENIVLENGVVNWYSKIGVKCKGQTRIGCQSGSTEIVANEVVQHLLIRITQAQRGRARWKNRRRTADPQRSGKEDAQLIRSEVQMKMHS